MIINLTKILTAISVTMLIACGSNQTDLADSQLTDGISPTTKSADFGQASSAVDIKVMSEKLSGYFSGQHANNPNALMGLQAKNNSATTTAPLIAASNVASPVYRFYNTRTGAHFFTMSAQERDYVKSTFPFFNFEGNSFYAYPQTDPSLSPVYRFYNNVTGTHFFTISADERDYVKATWPTIFTFEGISWHASTTPQAGWVPVYRFFNTKTGTHFYTSSAAERDNVIATLSWYSFEGIGYYVLDGAPVVLTNLSISVKSIGFETQEPFGWAQGDVRTLLTDARYSNGTTAAVSGAWSSSNTSVATVSATGVLNTLSPGDTTITVTYGGLTATKFIRVATPLATPLITVTCNSGAPTVISAATWNAQAANDSENTTKWIAVDGASCGNRADLQLIYKTSAGATSGTRIFQAFASPNGGFYPGRILRSASNLRMSVGAGVDVGYSAPGVTFYYLHYSTTVQ